MTEPLRAPPSERVFIAGVSGSGKSTAAWRMYLAKFPRRILLDQTGEWTDPSRFPQGYPGPDVTVYSVPELSYALHKYAPTGKWTIAASIDLEEMPDLVDYLIPIPDIAQSPIFACHGAVLLVDEVDLVAPPRSLLKEVRTLYRRSRHAGLSVVSTTQRPEAVSREVTAQSGQMLCLALTERSAYAYMSDAMGTDLTTSLPGWVRQHPHGGLWWERQTGRKLWLSESGAFVTPRAAGPRAARPSGPPSAALAPAPARVPASASAASGDLTSDDADEEPEA